MSLDEVSSGSNNIWNSWTNRIFEVSDEVRESYNSILGTINELSERLKSWEIKEEEYEEMRASLEITLWRIMD